MPGTPLSLLEREEIAVALVESTKTKIPVLTRVAFGFRSPEALIAMTMLAVGGVCPELPGRERTLSPEASTG